MKKCIMIAVLGTIVTIAGCNPNNEVLQEQTATEQLTEAATKEETTSLETSAAELTETEQSGIETAIEAEKSYYGDWLITGCLGTSAVYALSQEEIDDYVGTQITYENDQYSYNGNSISINGYEEQMETTETFAVDFGVPYSELGINEGEILSVSAMTEGNFFGGYFYVIDENTLMIYYEGVFFKGVREI